MDLPEVATHTSDAGARFEIIEVFAGGMGLCVHLRHVSTGSHYALKGIRPDLIEGRAIADRFGEELRVWLSASMCSLVAEAIAVVRVNESPCVLAPWMRNGDLAHALARFGPQQKFEAAVRIVRGLSWVHAELGIIHRDLKPANILLDEADLAYVADWGLARPVDRAYATIAAALDPGGLQRPQLTQAGAFVGTVSYAAPEQILGSSKIDHRADIYSVGCMLFEFEAGRPPFQGATATLIARQHLYVEPPSLRRWLRRTTLGVEDVVERCMRKDPAARYATYAELEDALVRVAERRAFGLERCAASMRYTRPVLGAGRELQNSVVATPRVQGRDGYGIVEFCDVAPFLEEAGNLIALRRFDEAEALLRPHFISDLLGGKGEWHYGHAIATNYGHCLVNIPERLEEGLRVFQGLDSLAGKPAEFYVNFSQGLLIRKDWAGATAVCTRGLRRFPDDIDLLGNQTIALTSKGALEPALESARRRLRLRKDIHSLNEGALVLRALRNHERNRNLPAAVTLAKEQATLVNEGLMLNPRMTALLLKQIDLHRFAHDSGSAMALCTAALESKDSPRVLREAAWVESLEMLAEAAEVNDVLRRIPNDPSSVADPEFKDRLAALKWRLFARHHMIGKERPDGKRVLVRQVFDYYLPGGKVADKDPVVTAEVLAWMDREDEALDILTEHLQTTPEDWEGTRAMVTILVRNRLLERAVACAESCNRAAPWRAESYDCLHYAAGKAGLTRMAEEAKRRGDEVYEREKRLFEELRSALSPT